MKKLIIIITSLLHFAIYFVASQVPENMNYQAIIRDITGNVITSSEVSIRLSIISSNIFGSAVYVETHFLPTNQFGLVNLAVGSGNSVFGSIDGIKWGESTFFLKIEIDEKGGVDYTDLGTTQLLSVPYALHAKTAGNVFSGDYQDLTNKPDFIGWDINEADDFDGDYSSLVRAPTSLSDFTNDMGYVSENDFTGWDQDASDDFSGDFNDLTNIPPGLLDGDDNTQLSESQVETYITNGPIDLAEGSKVNGKLINDWNSLQNIPPDIADGDNVLTEAQVDAFVSNNGYLIAEVDGSVTNELQNLDQVLTLGNDAGGKQINNLGQGIESNDIVNKEYVDQLLDRLNKLKSDLFISDSGTFKDMRDKNTYKWIHIGDQIWLAENMAYLPYINPQTESSITEPRYYVNGYEGTTLSNAKLHANYELFGVLYNWVAATTACPNGWHLPTVDEWNALLDYLIENGYNYDGTTTENKVSKSLAGTEYWQYSSIPGSVGNPDYPEKINASGFSALPGGSTYYDYGMGYYKFSEPGMTGLWWTNTEEGPIISTNFWINSESIQPYFTGDRKLYGYSVRCIKDD